MRYLVWAGDYAHGARGGQKALHRLCHELNLAGQEAYVPKKRATNPDWVTPSWYGPTDDLVAVYPEIVRGNPFGAPRVARWVLNVPGLLGGDAAYDPTEMVFSWARQFLDDVPLLHIPYIETDIYTDRGLPRSGELYFVGKGILGPTFSAIPVTQEMRNDRFALAEALNRATLLRCFDDTTAMVDIARMCGCPVLVVPTRKRVEPGNVRAEYRALWPAFRCQLENFISVTQVG